MSAPAVSDKFKASSRSTTRSRPAHDDASFRENEHGDAVYCVAALDASRFLTVGARDTIKLWDADAADGREQPAPRVFGLNDQDHPESVSSVSSVARFDDTHFLTGGSDPTYRGSVVRLWSVLDRDRTDDGQSSSSSSSIAKFDVWHRGTVTAVASVSWDAFACGIGYNGTYGGMVLVYSISRGECTQTLGHPEEVGPIAALGDGVHLLTGDATGSVRLWSASTGECLRRYDEGRGREEVLALAVDAGGERFVAVSRDHAFRVWDVKSGHCALRVDAAHSDFIYSVSWVDDATLATASRDRTVRLWKLLNSGECSAAKCIDVHTHTAPVLAMTSLGGSGGRVCGGGARSRRLVVCDARGDLRLLSFPSNWDVLGPYVLLRELLRRGRATARARPCPPWLLACLGGGRKAETVLRALVAPPTGAPHGGGLPNELFERTLSFLAPRPIAYAHQRAHAGGGG